MAVIINTADLHTEELMNKLSPEQIEWCYNGLDVCVTAEVLNVLLPQLDNVTTPTYNFSKSLQAPMLEMMMRGLLVNQNKRHVVITEMKRKIKLLEEQLNELVLEGIGWAGAFNWRSPLQLNNLFYKLLELPAVKKKNAQGIYAPTTNRDAMEKLSSYYIAEPLCLHLLALRDLAKAVGFLETEIDPDGRMRSNFNIAGTTTGRLASSASDLGTGTNLQNVARDLRSIFVADPGYKFANLDLEQADSRNVGALNWNLFCEHPELMAKFLGNNKSYTEADAGAYLDACEAGDLHTLVTRMSQPGLQWGQGLTDRQIADQIAYREYSYRDLSKKLGHGCLTPDHEVLTRNGWVSITEKPEEILAWSQDGSQFEQVSYWTDKEYSGILHRFVGNSMDLRMTADHRVPYVSDQRRPILNVRPAELGPQVFMPLGGKYVGGTDVVPAKIIAAVMCDGHIEKNWTAFHFHKPRKAKRLIELCREYGIVFAVHGDKIRIRGNYPKYPGAFMFNWTKECLKEFLLELRHWDGHVSATAVSISSARRQDLEWYQTFGRILGIGGSIQNPQASGFGTTIYRLQQNNRQYANGSSSSHEKISVVEQRVLCPTVPSSFFYVRRNGKICVTGNSNYLGKPPTMASHAKIPTAMAALFQKNYFTAFPAIPAWHRVVAQDLLNYSQITTLFGRRRYFFGRPKEDATLREAVAYAPQSMTGDEINTGIMNLWRADRIQLLVQVHDSILFQYREEEENEIIPWALEALKAPLVLKKGREFVVPTEAQIGWNWGYYDKDKNPDGLTKWKGGDSRKRQETKFKLSISEF